MELFSRYIVLYHGKNLHLLTLLKVNMITSITSLIDSIQKDLSTWDFKAKPWFRGESGNVPSLCPKIAQPQYRAEHENYVLQSFRRKAGGLANVPNRNDDDLWLFLAQHYGVPTRLLDWTEGALHALYFAVNKKNPNPRVFMLNPYNLNKLAGFDARPNYPLSWGTPFSSAYVALAWHNRAVAIPIIPENRNIDFSIPIAFPATYQDQRMIAQRSCFTIHGTELKTIKEILKQKRRRPKDYLFEYKIDFRKTKTILKELSMLGISAASIFPDLDHLADDLVADIENL